jgi:hypothetical protein
MVLAEQGLFQDKNLKSLCFWQSSAKTDELLIPLR